jgi:molybdopterin-guanine dinucleotide biosynthesis protein A
MYNNISGVVLAGGANKRFGGIIKSNILFTGKPIISLITETLGFIFNELIIVTNTPSEFMDNSSCKIVGDIFTGTGPLGGIHAALKASSGEAIFVFAGDMPYLNSELIINQIDSFLENESDALVPRMNQNIEPLHSIYNRKVIWKLEEYLNSKQNVAVHEFLKRIDARYLNIEDSEETKKAFTNINSPSDIVFY